MGDDRRGYSGLVNEPVEGDEICVAGFGEESGEDGVDGVDGGAAVGVDGVTDEEGGFVEIAGAEEGEDVVVEIQAGAGEGGCGVGELRDAWDW